MPATTPDVACDAAGHDWGAQLTGGPEHADGGRSPAPDATTGDALRVLLADLEAVRPDDVPRLARLVEAAVPWVHHVELYLADYDHTVLRRVATGGEVASPDELPVLGSPAGEVFRTQQPRWEVEGPDPVLWVALTNRWRRLGVVRLRLGALEGAGPRDARTDQAGLVAAALAQELDSADA